MEYCRHISVYYFLTFIFYNFFNSYKMIKNLYEMRGFLKQFWIFKTNLFGSFLLTEFGLKPCKK